MIVHRSKTVRVRTTREVDTRGMMPKVGRASRDREAGRRAARAGRHSGGPCPAVCIATLTGWSYGEAASWLRERYGFKGVGILVPLMHAAMRELFTELRQVHAVGSVQRTVQRRFAGKSGYVCCEGHVMPVLDGRLLNAAGCEDKTCTCAYIIEK